MRKKKVHAIAIKSFALLVVLGTAYQARSQDAATPYPKMAPIDQYLMTDRGAEIALARSAAPESISGDAEVLVLGRHGFETAVKGKNGFVCIVGRGWSSAADPDFWNPKVRVPICMNSPAARTYLLAIRKITDLALAGRNLAEVNEAIADATAKKELPAMEPGAMCHDWETRIWWGRRCALASSPHVFYSDTDPAIWGANLPGSPVIGIADPLSHLTQFVIAIERYSDGTAAPTTAEHKH